MATPSVRGARLAAQRLSEWCDITLRVREDRGPAAAVSVWVCPPRASGSHHPRDRAYEDAGLLVCNCVVEDRDRDDAEGFAMSAFAFELRAL